MLERFGRPYQDYVAKTKRLSGIVRLGKRKSGCDLGSTIVS